MPRLPPIVMAARPGDIIATYAARLQQLTLHFHLSHIA
jgi:hypothetical protein